VFFIGTIIGILKLKPKGKRKKNVEKRSIEEIDMIGETEEGFIIYETKGENDERKE